MSEANPNQINTTYYPISENTTPFVYSIWFQGVNPIGAVAIAVATNGDSALRAFKNFLFTYNTNLYEKNKGLTTGAVTKVFCEAEIGRAHV